MARNLRKARKAATERSDKLVGKHRQTCRSITAAMRALKERFPLKTATEIALRVGDGKDGDIRNAERWLAGTELRAAYDSDPVAKQAGSLAASKAGVDTAELVIRGGTHFEGAFIPNPAFTGTLRGNDLVAWYARAWFDKYVKGDPSADAQLLTDRWKADQREGAVDPDGDGKVAHVIPKASPKTHDDEVLKASAPAYALGLVRGTHLVSSDLAEVVRKVRRDGQIRETELLMARPGAAPRHGKVAIDHEKSPANSPGGNDLAHRHDRMIAIHDSR